MAEEALSKVVAELIKPSWLIVSGAVIYASTTMRAQLRADQEHGPLDCLVDFAIAGFAGLLFLAGALAAGWPLGWAGFAGGVGGSMGSKGLVVLGDAITSFIAMLTKKWGGK